MTDHPLSIPIEELVLSIQVLIEQEKELLENNKAQGDANYEHSQQIATLVEQLVSLLKTYQDKEQLIIDNTDQALKNNINAAFQKNQADYHALINKGFTTHIDQATERLSTVATEVKQDLDDLTLAAKNSKTEFKSRQHYFEQYENTYDTESQALKESVRATLSQVPLDAKKQLDKVGTDFANELAEKLSWKVTYQLGAVCFLIMLLTFGYAWLFVPSKGDIAQRQAEYDAIEAAKLLGNIVKSYNGYYGNVDIKNCQVNLKSEYWGKDSTWCKFK